MLILPVLLAFTPLAPNDATHRDALTKYGYSRWLAGKQQLASAATQLEGAARLDPAAVAPKRDLVRIYTDLGRDAAAMRLAKQVLEATPADTVTAQTLARLYQDTKQYREAGDVIANALKNDKLPPHRRLSLLRDLARFRKQASDWPAARTAFSDLMQFLASEEKSLVRDGFDVAELRHERGAAAEQLGNCHMELRQYRDALTAYESAAKLFADEPNAAARLNWNLSGVYAAANEPEKAVAAIEAFINMKPKNVASYQRYANLLRVTNRGVPARLSELAKANPTIPAIMWVAVAEWARLDFESAHLRFQALLATTTDEAFFDLLLKTYAEQNRPNELLAIADELFPVTEKKAVVPAAQSDRQQAFANALGKEMTLAAPLLKAARGSAHSTELWELLAWLAERADLSDDLETALRAAVKSASGDHVFPSIMRLATHLARHRKWEELIVFVSRPDFEGNGAIFRSEALAELGRGDEALDSLKNLKNFANFATRRQTAHVLGILGRNEEKLKTLDEMLNDFKTSEDVRRIRIMRADALLGLNRFNDMEAEVRMILEDDPDDVLALNNLGYNLADRNKKLPEAELLIRRAIELDRRERVKAGEARLENAAYLDSLGWVLFRRGQLKEARIELEKAADLPEGRADGVVWDHLGDVCYRLGDKPAAKKAWQQADVKYVGDHRGKLGGRAEEVKHKLKLVD